MNRQRTHGWNELFVVGYKSQYANSRQCKNCPAKMMTPVITEILCNMHAYIMIDEMKPFFFFPLFHNGHI